MDSKPTVFSFTDPIEFLNFEFRSRQRKNARFSLRAWARQLGYENPSYVSHILKRDRKLKIDLAHRFAENLQLSNKEKKYFELIVLNHSSESDVHKRMFQKLIAKSRPNALQTEDFPVEKFELASEWYHWAILELFYLKDFSPNEDFIYRRLGPKVTKKMIRESLKKLTELKCIEATPDGGFRRANDNAIFAKPFPTWAIRLYHRTMIEKAKEAIDQKKPENRNLRGTMLALTKTNYDKALEIISEAHKKVLALTADTDGDDVYYFGSQIFPVTESAKETLH